MARISAVSLVMLRQSAGLSSYLSCSSSSESSPSAARTAVNDEAVSYVAGEVDRSAAQHNDVAHGETPLRSCGIGFEFGFATLSAVAALGVWGLSELRLVLASRVGGPVRGLAAASDGDRTGALSLDSIQASRVFFGVDRVPSLNTGTLARRRSLPGGRESCLRMGMPRSRI